MILSHRMPDTRYMSSWLQNHGIYGAFCNPPMTALSKCSDIFFAGVLQKLVKHVPKPNRSKSTLQTRLRPKTPNPNRGQVPQTQPSTAGKHHGAYTARSGHSQACYKRSSPSLFLNSPCRRWLAFKLTRPPHDNTMKHHETPSLLPRENSNGKRLHVTGLRATGCRLASLSNKLFPSCDPDPETL